MLVAHPTAAQDHRFEADPVASVRENFVACEVLSQLQRVIDNPRFLLTGECEPLTAGRRVHVATLFSGAGVGSGVVFVNLSWGGHSGISAP
jgi:hypothetical protein